jgi:hypothetical protein
MDEATLNLKFHCLQKGMDVYAGMKDHSLVLHAARAFEKYLTNELTETTQTAKLYTIEGSKK